MPTARLLPTPLMVHPLHGTPSLYPFAQDSTPIKDGTLC